MSESWSELFRAALTTPTAQPAVLALATVDREGHPQVRSVICRECDESGALWMTCDSRSGKVTDVSIYPGAAASCWIPEVRQQFRMNGPVEICAEPAQRNKRWLYLKPETRATFFWPMPGSHKAPESEFLKESHQALPPETFTVLILRPESVELLELNLHPHRRRRWIRANGWQAQELNP